MNRVLALIATLFVLQIPSAAHAATKYFIGSGVWTNASNWSLTSGGPYDQVWVSGDAAVFDVVSSVVTGATTSFSSLTANQDVTLTPNGTIGTGGTTALVTVATGKSLNFGGQQISTTVGTGFIKDGDGTWNIGTAGTYGGGFWLNAGTVGIGGNNALGVAGALTISGGTTLRSTTNTARDLTGKVVGGIFINGDFTFGGTATLTFNATTHLGGAVRTITCLNTTILNGVIGGTAGNGLTKAGAGILTLGGTNTFDGKTTVTEGGLRINDEIRLGSAPASFTSDQLTLNGGALLAAGTFTLDDANRGITLGSSGGTLDSQAVSNTLTVAIPIAGVGTLTKTAAGVVILSSSNTYSGGTTLGGGTTLVSNVTGSGTGTGTVIVATNATLGGSGTVLGSVTIQAGGRLAPGNHAAGTLNVNELTLASGSKFTFELGATNGSNDKVLINGALTLNGQQFTDFTFTPIAGFEAAGTYVLMDAASISGGLGATTNGSVGAYHTGVLSVDSGSGNLLLTVTVSSHVWDGGASTVYFGDGANWYPEAFFTGSNPLQSGNNFGIESAASVTTAGTNINFVSLTLDHANAVMTVAADSSVTNSGGVWIEGTMEVYGRLDAGGGVISSGNSSDDFAMNIYTGGYFSGIGNNSFGGNINNNRDVVINVWGQALLKVAMLAQWATASTNNNFTVKVNSGGLLNASLAGSGNISMRCDSNSTARIELAGGTFNLGPTNNYAYVNMTNAPGNGIVFTSVGSVLTVNGDATNAVRVWIDAGTLFSEVPSSTIQNVYDATSNKTFVTLSVAGGDPVLGVSPATHDFGGVQVGQGAATFTFTVTNGGGMLLTGTAALVGSPYAVDSGSPFSVPAAGSANVIISFAPTLAQDYGDSVVFISNGGGATNALTGYGFIVAASTNSLIGMVGGNPQLGFGLASGALYRVEASTNLLDGASWTNLTGQLTNRAGATVTFSDTNSAGYPQRAYRVSSP